MSDINSNITFFIDFIDKSSKIIPDEWASGGHDYPVRGQWHSVVADQNQVRVAGAAPRCPHLVQDAGVVLAVCQSQQALAHHSSTETKKKHYKYSKIQTSHTCQGQPQGHAELLRGEFKIQPCSLGANTTQGGRVEDFVCVLKILQYGK